MALYLFMDGVDDILRVPGGITFDKIVLDIEISNTQSGTYRAILENSPAANSNLQVGAGNASATYTGTNMITGSAWNTWKVDNVVTKAYTTNNRFLLEMGVTVAIQTESTNGMEIFAFKNGGGILKGNIYNVKLYNSGTVVVHYDTTTGNVQDQSGNGYHGVLTGGTFVDDGAGGGTDVTVNASIADTIADTLVPNISTESSVSVSIDTVVANTSADMLLPSFSIGGGANILSVVANVVADTINPSAEVVRNIGLTVPISIAVASAVLPNVYVPVVFRVVVPITSNVITLMPISTNVISATNINSSV